LTKDLKTNTREKTASSTNAAGKTVIYMQKTKTRLLSLTLYKNYFKWIKDLNVRPKTLTLLQEKKNRENPGRYRPR
jgi:hypothetical protein